MQRTSRKFVYRIQVAEQVSRIGEPRRNAGLSISVGEEKRVAGIGLTLGVYGAVLATSNSVFQLTAYLRDRADVHLKVRNNMVSKNDARRSGIKMTLVTATNRGKRPVTITMFVARLLDTRTELLLSDTKPVLPFTITEGQQVSVFVNEEQHLLKYVESYYVVDSVGRIFRTDLSPWYRRLASQYKRKFSPVAVD